MTALKYQISSPLHELVTWRQKWEEVIDISNHVSPQHFSSDTKNDNFSHDYTFVAPLWLYVTLPVTDEWSHIGRFSAESDIITSAIKISINKTRTNQITCTAALYKNSQDISCHLLLVLYTSRNYLYLLDCGRWGGPSVRPICEYPQYILDRF